MAEGVKPLSRMMLRTQECSGLSLTGLKVALKWPVWLAITEEQNQPNFSSVVWQERKLLALGRPMLVERDLRTYKKKEKQILTNGHFQKSRIIPRKSWLRMLNNVWFLSFSLDTWSVGRPLQRQKRHLS